MIAAMLLASVSQGAAAPSQYEHFARDVGVRVRRVAPSGEPALREGHPSEWVEEVFAKDEKGKWRLVLLSPSHPLLAKPAADLRPTSLKRAGTGLFREAPTHAFRHALLQTHHGGAQLMLSREDEGVKVEKVVTIPAKGRVLTVWIQATFARPALQIEYFLDSYAFLPDRARLSDGGKPDSTFSPGLRPKDDQVVGDHYFRAPVISAQKGALAALMLPDLDVLADNRAMPTILDLDAKNGVVDATLMSYGFADHQLNGHVYYRHDQSMVRKVPKELVLAYDLIVDAQAEPFAAYRQAVEHTWKRYGKASFDKVLPQAMPFEEYAKFCYPAAFGEAYGDNKLGWFEVVIDGVVCGGIPAGWGFTNGWVSWQCWFNQLRSAWGLRWWGKRLGNADWVDKADKMLNLALAAPMDRGAVPTTYLSREKQWRGCLIMPRQECYYDLTNMAWKGIWMLRWLEFEDCPRRDEILRQCREMAELMMRHQNADGSFPTWLTKEHAVVPILDRSAQGALPAWFLGEMAIRDLSWSSSVMAKYSPGGLRQSIKETAEKLGEPARSDSLAVESLYSVDARMYGAAQKAASFLIEHVVDQQRYYDFETFFSCSPKGCMQVNGVLDDVLMHDPHTLSPPQNTLCMQWTAEALWRAADLVEGRSFPSPLEGEGVPRLAGEREGGNAANGVGAAPHPSSLRSQALPLEGGGGLASKYRVAALKALDIMALYQNVWSLPYRPAAYTFGGFGVQNSDGEYLDARQAQFGCTLADFGAALGRRDYFERGVAAVRASMTLINHPLHSQNGLYPNPNYPPGLQPENTGHGGTDQQNGRTGFDWGEGSGLAAMAWLLHQADRTDRTDPLARTNWANWKSLIDGGYEGQKHFPKPPAPLVDPAFDFSDWRMKGWTVEGNFAEVPTYSTRMDFGVADGEAFIGTCEDGRGGYDDTYTGVITSPAFLVAKPKIKLLVGGGAGENVYVELVEDPSGGTTFDLRPATFIRLHIARGQNRERMREVVWDVSALRGKTLSIRIVDRETGGWGHINVARIRCED